jgi:hypothetical protein
VTHTPAPGDLLTSALLNATTPEQIAYLIDAGAQPSRVQDTPGTSGRSPAHLTLHHEPTIDNAVAHWIGPHVNEPCAQYAAATATHPDTLHHIATTDSRPNIIHGLCSNPHLSADTTRHITRTLVSTPDINTVAFRTLSIRNQHLNIVADTYTDAYPTLNETSRHSAYRLIGSLIGDGDIDRARTLITAVAEHHTTDDQPTLHTLITRALGSERTRAHRQRITRHTLLDAFVGTPHEHAAVTALLTHKHVGADDDFISRCSTHYPAQLYSFLSSSYTPHPDLSRHDTARALLRFAAHHNITVADNLTSALMAILRNSSEPLHGTCNNHTLVDDIITITAGADADLTMRVIRFCHLTNDELAHIITTRNPQDVCRLTTALLIMRREQERDDDPHSPDSLYFTALTHLIQGPLNDWRDALTLLNDRRERTDWSAAADTDLNRHRDLSRQLADHNADPAHLSGGALEGYISLCRHGDRDYFDNRNWRHLLHPNYINMLADTFMRRDCPAAVATTATAFMLDNPHSGHTLDTIIDVAHTLTPRPH